MSEREKFEAALDTAIAKSSSCVEAEYRTIVLDMWDALEQELEITQIQLKMRPKPYADTDGLVQELEEARAALKQREPAGFVLTWNDKAELVAVTRQDEEGQIQEVIWIQPDAARQAQKGEKG